MRKMMVAGLMCALGLTVSSAWGGVVNANNGLSAGQVGWTAKPGDTIPITVTITPQSGDASKLSGADIALDITGPGLYWPTMQSADGAHPVDLTGSGLLFAGGTQVADSGQGTPSVASSVYISNSALYPLFTSTTGYKLYQFKLTVPSNAATGLYNLDISNMDASDSNGDLITLNTVNGTLQVLPVPEPATYAALAGLTVVGISVWRWRRRAAVPASATDDDLGPVAVDATNPLCPARTRRPVRS